MAMLADFFPLSVWQSRVGRSIDRAVGKSNWLLSRLLLLASVRPTVDRAAAKRNNKRSADRAQHATIATRA